MTSKDLHTAILDSNFTIGRRKGIISRFILIKLIKCFVIPIKSYIGRCSQNFRGKKAIHVACGETYTKVNFEIVRILV